MNNFISTVQKMKQQQIQKDLIAFHTSTKCTLILMDAIHLIEYLCLVHHEMDIVFIPHIHFNV